jgi:hypothetical protein
MIVSDRIGASPRQPEFWLAGIAAVSALALLAALVLQYGFGFAPCQLCLWERWPYLIVVALAAGGLLMGVPRTALVIVLLVLLGGIALAGFHVGVEPVARRLEPHAGERPGRGHRPRALGRPPQELSSTGTRAPRRMSRVTPPSTTSRRRGRP